MTLTIIKAPQALPPHKRIVPRSVFLAGSIEMGAAEDWQEIVTEAARKKYGNRKSEHFIFNPRREEWDSSWKQTIDSPKFYEQVSWELTALDCAQRIFMYYDPTSKSPISLLELGLHARGKRLIVCCPDGYWRKGNVEIVCSKYKIDLYNDLEEAMNCLTS